MRAKSQWSLFASRLSAGECSARRGNHFLIANACRLRRPTTNHPMKLRNFPRVAALSSVLSFFSVSGWAETIKMPEDSLPALGAIIQQALKQSPRMVSRSLDMEIAENDRVQARAGLLPSVGASYRDYQARDDREDLSGRVDVRKVYYDISLTQPLFHWGERRNTAKMWDIRKKIAEGQYREGYRLLAQELRAKYLTLIVQKLAVEKARANDRFAREQLKLAEERRAKNVISDMEMFGPRLTAERAAIDVDRLEFDFTSALEGFARLAGLVNFSQQDVPDAVPAQASASASFDQMLSDYLAMAELPSVEARNARHQLEVAQLDYKNQRTRLLPKFNFALGLSQDEQNYTVNVAQKYQVNSLYAGVSVNWNIFDSFASQAAVRNALARRRQQENEYKELTARLVAQAKTQNKQAYLASRSMAINDRFLESAQGNLQSKQDEFKRGLISESDLTVAQLGLLDARINAYNSRTDYLLRVGDLLGTLDRDPAVAQLNSSP